MSTDHSSVSLLPLHYAGHQIRSYIDAHGRMWWVAQDVAEILGILHIRSTLRKFPAHHKGVHNMHTLGGIQECLMLSEPGLWHLIFISRKPEAEAFQLWVWDEVLPSLRRTGTYTIPHTAPEPVLTAAGQLPPPPPRVREHAEVSWHLAAVWTLLRDSQEVLTNHEIAHRTGIARRTARAHTQYLLHLGLLNVHATFPRHLYQLAAEAERRNPGCYQRLNRLTALMQARHAF